MNNSTFEGLKDKLEKKSEKAVPWSKGIGSKLKMTELKLTD